MSLLLILNDNANILFDHNLQIEITIIAHKI